MKKIAVIGATGWVGKSMMALFPDAVMYAPHTYRVKDIETEEITFQPEEMSHSSGNIYTKLDSKKQVNKCDVAFICVPTPFDGYKLDVSIIEGIMKWLEVPLVVMRSTVNPGDCDRWQIKYSKKIVFQPEYLGETPNHPLLDTKKAHFMILGGEPLYRKEVIDLYTTTYNANITIRQMSLYEAEIVKLTENRAIAYKMMQCQELYDVCKKAGVDYYTIRDAVYADDPRFNLWFTFVYPDNRGFGSSKCLSKDVPAWCAWAESVGYEPEITRALIKKSNDYKLGI